MRRIIAVIAILVVAVGGWRAVRSFGSNDGMVVQTAAVVRGPLRMTVETTGTVSPLVSVNVGCEVSGTIGEIHADFNSQVKAGQVLARLKPELFEADLAQAQANVLAAEAQRRVQEVEARRARRQVERLTRLRNERGAAAEEEVRTAEENRDAAEARLTAAEASVKQAEAARDLQQSTLDRSVIYSPIDGIVLNRLVDVGQTVAAALTTPVLFVMAPDLDRMQVHANVSESDIGSVQAGQTAEFTVDAYAQRRFIGRVSQVRNNPTTIQGVVTYTVVIEVDNRDRLLKPGMTANVTIEVARRVDAIKVSNAALRFRPPIPPEEVAALTADLGWPDALEDPPAAASMPQATTGGASPTAAHGGAQAVLWCRQRDGWRPIPVVLGITDNRETEVLAGVEAGTAVVVSAKVASPGFDFKEALNMASPENRRL
ncbi:MAG: efflux RND transporter periplasmic adaptor subunit [Phycisphaerae bacterium]|nr:efflux RND transporter periplasmic adaptor subunit [Phycisphaerae bacterium]